MPGEGYYGYDGRGRVERETVLCIGTCRGCGQQDHDSGGGQQEHPEAHYVQGGGLPAD